jgi:hypothetical protein
MCWFCAIRSRQFAAEAPEEEEEIEAPATETPAEPQVTGAPTASSAARATSMSSE